MRLALWAISCPIIQPLHGHQIHCGSYLPRQDHTYRGGNQGFPKPSHCAANTSFTAASQYQSVAVPPGNPLPLSIPGIIALPVGKSNGSILPAAPTCRLKSDSGIFLWFYAQRQAKYQASALNTARYGLNQVIRVPKTASAQNFGHIGLVLE